MSSPPIRHSFAALLFAFGAMPSVSRAEKPNIVIVLADDLGCYGATRLRTPHMDRMAREGLRFTDFHSNGVLRGQKVGMHEGGHRVPCIA